MATEQSDKKHNAHVKGVQRKRQQQQQQQNPGMATSPTVAASEPMVSTTRNAATKAKKLGALDKGTPTSMKRAPSDPTARGGRVSTAAVALVAPVRSNDNHAGDNHHHVNSNQKRSNNNSNSNNSNDNNSAQDISLVGAFRIRGPDGVDRSDSFRSFNSSVRGGLVPPLPLPDRPNDIGSSNRDNNTDNRTLVPPTMQAQVTSTTAASSQAIVIADEIHEMVTARAVLAEDDNESDNSYNNKRDKESMKHIPMCCGIRRKTLVMVAAAFLLLVLTIVVGVSLGILLQNRQESPAIGNNNTYIPLAGLQSINTTLEVNKCAFGIVFDVTANAELDLITIVLNLNSTQNEDISVYSRPGQYRGYESNASSWILLGNASVVGRGLYYWTPLPENLFPPLHVTKGSRQALYVLANRPIVCFMESLPSGVNGSTSFDYESAAYTNPYVDLNVGTYAIDPFVRYGPPAAFSGIIYYKLS